MDKMEHPELRAHKEFKVLQAQRDLRVPLERKEHKVLQVQLVLQVHQERAAVEDSLVLAAEKFHWVPAMTA
jgi:hypothetical protein